MPTETMTPRERWLAVLSGQKPDRVPMDYWGTAEATAKVRKYLGCHTNWQMFRKLRIDKVVGVAPKYVGPRRRGYDMYGCRTQMVDYGSGAYREVVSAPLAEYETVKEIAEKYTWPSPDWFDYSEIPAQVKGKDAYPVRGGGSEPFLVYCNLRGREQAYMDLVLNPEIVHYCLDKLFALAYENTCRIYAQIPGRVDMSYVAEDFGGQSSLLFSPDTIRTFFIPRMKRMIDLAHENGAKVFFHSDGAIRTIIPDMLAAGIDILNPIQWRSPGMERVELKRDFGSRVVFHGAMDNQQTLPFGTVDDVRAEVEENLAVLGAGGGYILAPCHNIQAVSPAENVVVMYEAGYEFGWV